MSKDLSNLFEGTHGDIVARAIKLSVQRAELLKWADEVSMSLSSISKRKRDKFKTACVAVDEQTGMMFFGKNGGIGRDGADIHQSLRAVMPNESLNNYPTPWNCAEADAINQALYAGASLSDIHIYTISTAARGRGDNEYGHDKRSCENCTFAFRGRIRRNNTGWTD